MNSIADLIIVGLLVVPCVVVWFIFGIIERESILGPTDDSKKKGFN